MLRNGVYYDDGNRPDEISASIRACTGANFLFENDLTKQDR